MKMLVVLLTVTTFGLMVNSLMLMQRVDHLQDQMLSLAQTQTTMAETDKHLLNIAESHTASIQNLTGSMATFLSEIGKPGQILCGDTRGLLEWRYPSASGHCPPQQ